MTTATLEKIAPQAKAFIGALVAFLTAIATALDNGSISAQEWVFALIALIAGFGAVFSIPNKPPFVPEQEPEPEPVAPKVQSTSARAKQK